MEWSRLEIYKLIKEYQVRRLLWDTEDENYKCRFKKTKALTEIAESLGIDQLECEKKLRNLVSQFQREVKKIKQTPNYHSKWFAFETMLFLEDRKKNEGVFALDLLDGLNPTIEIPSSSPDDDQDYFSKMNVKPEMDDSLSASSSQATVPVRPRSYYDYPRQEKRRKHSNEFYHHSPPSYIGIGGRDEFNIFGEHIANKIRKLPSVHAQNTVQHLISNLLYEAELGKYNHRERSIGNVSN